MSTSANRTLCQQWFFIIGYASSFDMVLLHHVKNISVACFSLSAWADPFVWFAVLHLTEKLFTPQLFTISKGWHWMLSVMTAIGISVCRPIVTLVCVYHHCDLRQYDISRECYTAGIMSTLFNDNPIANIMVQITQYSSWNSVLFYHGFCIFVKK